LYWQVEVWLFFRNNPEVVMLLYFVSGRKVPVKLRQDFAKVNFFYFCKGE